MFRNVDINGSPAPGYSCGQAIAAMEGVAKSSLPQGYTYAWTGLSFEEIQAGGKSLQLFALGLLVVYLTLSAQYESFVLPFIILLAVPMAVLGKVRGPAAPGHPKAIYFPIPLRLLVGLG